MKLTVLGNSGPYPSAERPCSGYVVELNNKLIILDLGSGTLMNFQKSYNIEDISLLSYPIFILTTCQIFWFTLCITS